MDYRVCQFCGQSDPVWRRDEYVLFKYGVRHYAHAICLAKRHGVNGGMDRIPEHERKDYKFALSLLKPSGWEMTIAKSVDMQRGPAFRGAVRP